MIKSNTDYEYKIFYTIDNIKCYKKKSGSRWYKIKPDTYYKETGVKFNINLNLNSFNNNYIEFTEK